MINNIFYILIMTLFLDFSIGATKFSGVHRTFQLLYRGAFEVSVATIDKDGETKPYFNETVLEEYIDRYFEKNLKRYVKHYTVSYYYYHSDSNLVCLDHECDAFKISLKADIAGFFSYEKAKTFSIVEGRISNEQ